MNLASVDLNLLVVFEALFDTRSVTLAAERVSRAQPSVSNALARLRLTFGDELFVRSAAGMVPTDRAQALALPIARALDQIRRTLEAGIPFDPAAAGKRRFSIAASDYTDIVVVPRIVARLRAEAPAISLRVTALNRARLYEQLDEGSVDLAVAGHLMPPKRMLAASLYEEHFVCVMDRAQMPKRGRLTLEKYLAMPHALFVPSDDGSVRGEIDVALARLGRRRRVVCTFAHIVALPYAVAGSDLVATMASRAAHSLIHDPRLVVLPVPRELHSPPFSVDLVQSRRMIGDPALQWLAQAVRHAVQDL